MNTRWWLSRGPRGLVFLHLSEVGGRERGYCVAVADRHVAREYLPILRGHLAEAIERQDRPVRTFDPVEATGLAEPSDEQRDLVAALLNGTACPECGEDLAPGEPCAACAEKREILRQTFPRLYGDA